MHTYKISPGMIVTNPNYLKKGPMEIGARTMFRAMSVDESGGYAMCEPMDSPMMSLAESRDIELAPTPIALEDITPYFEGQSGAALNDLMVEALHRSPRSNSITIDLKVLKKVLDYHLPN